jgi:plasmid stabilization system protein ParE
MPAATLTFHRLAAQEFRRARSAYARRSRQAALRFIQAMDTALQQIAADPERWPLYDDRHCWVKTKKFPYLLIYRRTEEDRLTVVAVAHTSRRPGYWRRRLA